MNSILTNVYPVGSIYISVSSTNPGTLFGGTWVQITDTFLLAAGTTYASGTTGGQASTSYTPAGTNSGGAVGNHTLTTTEIPAHAHGLNSHTHTGPSHTHGLNSHTHTYDKASTSTGTNNNNTGSTTISFSNGYAALNSGASYVDFRFKSGSYTPTNGVQVYSNYYTTTSPHNQVVDLGGSQAHTHTLNSHNHSITLTSTNSGGNSGNTAAGGTGATGAATGNTANTGSGGAHGHGFTNPTFTGTAATINTMPPYLAVYVWKRTA